MVQEAQIIRANTLAVGCPFLMIVHTEAGKELKSEMIVEDITEIAVIQIKINTPYRVSIIPPRIITKIL